MNKFQILDEKGKAITINDLDLEAAIFWNKAIHPKSYASPEECYGANWFDIIGWNIAYQGHECAGWANVVATMMATNIGMKFIDLSKEYKDKPVKINTIEETMPKIKDLISFYQPYIELINHWQAKGYQPKQIKG
jgi:hypothetical protein